MEARGLDQPGMNKKFESIESIEIQHKSQTENDIAFTTYLRTTPRRARHGGGYTYIYIYIYMHLYCFSLLSVYRLCTYLLGLVKCVASCSTSSECTYD